MLILVQIILMIFGAILMVTGKFSLGGFEAEGAKVRQAGLILILPLAIGFTIGFVIGFTIALQGGTMTSDVFMLLTVMDVISTIVASAGAWMLLRQAKTEDYYNKEKVKTGLRYGSLSDFPSIMTLAEGAFYLRVSENELKQLIEGGLIPAAKMGSGYRIARSAIDQYLRESHAV